jgi:hypothetical protein
MNDSWCFWSVHLREIFCSRPHCLRCDLIIRVRVIFSLRLAVYRQTILGAKRLEINGHQFFMQLKLCGHSRYKTSSLTRRFAIAAGHRQCNDSPVRDPRDSWPYFTLSDSGLPQPGGQILVFISPKNRVAQLYPWHWVSLFIASYDLQSYSEGIRTRLHTMYITGSQNQSRRPPISSSWRKPPWDSWPLMFF